MYSRIYNNPNDIRFVESDDMFHEKWWYDLFVEEIVRDRSKTCFLALGNDDETRHDLILPLIRENREMKSMANFYTGLYGPIWNGKGKSEKRDALDHAFGTILKDKVDSIWLYPLEKEGEDYDLIFESLKRNHCLAVKYFCFGNWYLPCKDLGYEEYRDSLSSRLKNTIKRKTKKFAKDGGRIVLYDDKSHAEEAIGAYRRVYDSSWKQKETYPDFIRKLAFASAEQNALRIAAAWMGDKPVAAQFWIVHKAKGYIYKLAYDENYSEYSPGTILSNFLFEKVLERSDVHEIDYLIGDDSYKKDWMTHRRERWGIAAFNRKSVRGLARGARHVGAEKIKNFVRKTKLFRI